MPANSPIGRGTTADNALPKVAPTKNRGVTSPPLNPTPIVKVVNRIFSRKSYHICCSVNEATMVGTPKPIYFVVPIIQTASAITSPPISGRKGGYIIRKSKFPQNPKRSVRFSGKRTKRSVQKRKARNTQKAETKVL